MRNLMKWRGLRRGRILSRSLAAALARATAMLWGGLGFLPPASSRSPANALQVAVKVGQIWPCFLDFRSMIPCFVRVSIADKLTPSAFEKHIGRESQRRWKYYVWVIVKGKKVPLLKTSLLKYYEKVYGGSSHRGNKGRPFHRDEFVRCSGCNKERRFRLQTKADCRIYHDAVLDANWKCSDLPSDECCCDDEEERASRRSIRGCSRAALCKGCTLCVCFGCEMCRFSDCACQTCIDFVNNSAS